MELSFENMHMDHHNQQDDYILVAKDESNNPVGMIEYSLFQDEIHLNMIRAKEDMKRQGIGTSLINELKSIWQSTSINWGMMTDEGSALKQSLGSRMNWYRKAQSPTTLYHVTFTKYVPLIESEGIKPLQTSNWVSGFGDRYGKGEIFAMDNLTDATRWGAKMDWEFNQAMGTGEISIVEFQKGDEWEVDDSDPISQLGNEGEWVKRLKMVKPENILRSYPITTEMIQRITRGA